jgi:hypothetical protein
MLAGTTALLIDSSCAKHLRLGMSGCEIMRTGFVTYTVRPGLFDSEYLVAVAQSSALVSSGNVNVPSLVTKEGVEGRVRVYVLEECEDRALVELPGEAVVGGLRTWVPKPYFAAA